MLRSDVSTAFGTTVHKLRLLHAPASLRLLVSMGCTRLGAVARKGAALQRATSAVREPTQSGDMAMCCDVVQTLACRYFQALSEACRRGVSRAQKVGLTIVWPPSDAQSLAVSLLRSGMPEKHNSFQQLIHFRPPSGQGNVLHIRPCAGLGCSSHSTQGGRYALQHAVYQHRFGLAEDLNLSRC